ncbi:unnamed protein product [Symbiodinium microadriaticum]|nr:unnamed protein product [Symbiodinium microadriaticum]
MICYKHTFRLLLIGSIIILTGNLHAQSAKKFFKTGEDFVEAENYKDAIDQFNKAIELDSDFEDAYLERAKAKEKLGDLKEAAEDYKRLAAIDAGESEYFFNWGRIYYQMEMYDDCLEPLNKAIEEDKKYHKALQIRSKAYIKLDSFTMAIRDCNLAIDLEKKNPENYYNRAVAYDSLNEFALAEADLKQAIDYEMAGEMAHVALAEVQIEQEKYDEALASINTAIDKNKSNTNAYYVRSKIHFARKQFPEAINDLSTLLAIDPKNEMAYNQRGMYYQTLSKIEDNSLIKQIFIEGATASFIYEKKNPTFSATVNVANKDEITVTAEDIYGNKAERVFTLNREAARIAANNPMGKTWVIFIENSDYESFASLDGPEKDVTLMKSAFANYEIHNIIHKKNMSKSDLERFFSIELRDLIRSNRVNSILVWYAGHGKFINEAGYWIPVNAKRDDEFSYFNINSLKAYMLAYSKYVTHALVVTDACESGGISRIENGVASVWTSDSITSDDDITAILEDADGHLWISTYGNGAMLIENPEMDSLKELNVTQYRGQEGLSDRIFSMMMSNDKEVYFVTDVGIKKYNKEKDEFEFFRVEGVPAYFQITALFQDKNDNFWFGTYNGGLFKAFAGSEKVIMYDVKDGLADNWVSCLNEDKDGNIWVGTWGGGISKIYKGARGVGVTSITDTTFKIMEMEKHFTPTAFIEDEVKNQATFKDDDGNLWFGTIKGAFKYQADHARQNDLEPLTHITSFKVNLEPREMVDGMKLNYKEKEISFQFNSICLSDPTSIKFKYRLVGADQNWRPANKQTFVNYSPLPPNSYVFEVKAMNNDGVWNEEPASFSFKILPPFWQTWWFYLLCAIVAYGAIYFYIKIRERNLLKEKRVLEEKVEERTKEVVEKSEELEQKNNDILDSIRYAKVIQTAILPPDNLFQKLLPESFVLFKPKDIVSGDFYWIYTKEEKVLFAASDCTGHGVPGAFVSMVGYNLLDKIVGEYGITEPAAILDRLNFEVAQTFRQKGEEEEEIGTKVKDGMDIALVAFDTKTRTLEYAGAFNPLYLLRDDEIIEYKANRSPIGSFKAGEQEKFVNHKIDLKDGDCIYMFTDGFVDQFGGPRGKKFMAKRLRNTLVSIGLHPMAKQGEELQESIEDWMGDLEQVDDILGVGARFKF